jgi:hypothetical protein
MAWQNLITGAANGAINPLYGTELSRQRHEASQQHQRLGHMSKQELAQAIYSNAELYGGTGTPVGRQLHALVPQVTSLPDDGTLDQKLSALAARHAQLVSQGEQQLAQNHAGVQPIQTPPKQEAPTAANSNQFLRNPNPFSGMIAGPPAPGGAALPNANPLTSPPPAPGGGSSAATFPTPTPAGAPAPAPGPLGSGSAASPEPVPPGPGMAAANVGSPAAGSVPPIGAPPNIQPDIDEFNTSGYMSPVLRAMIPGQIGLHQSQQLLQAIQPILNNLGPVADQNGMPDVSKLMRMEAELSALGVKGGSNMAPLLLQMLSPRSEPGMQPFGSLSQKQKEFYAKTHPGEDISKIPPRTPARVISHKYSGDPLEINLQSENLHFGTDDQGNIIGVGARTGTGSVPTGQVAPSTLTPVNTGVDSTGKNVYESKGRIIKDLAEGKSVTGAGTNPAVLPHVGSEIRTVQTVDDQGRPVTELVPVQVSGRKVLPSKSGQIPATGAGASAGASAAGGGRSFLKPLTSTTQGMKEAAPKVLDLIDRIDPMITSQQRSLGPLAGRWSEFMSGKVGAPNPEFIKLRTDIGLLQTLLMRMHVGARGGRDMMAHFTGLIDSGKQSPENLHAALTEMREYAKDVLAEGPANVAPRSEIPPVPNAPGSVIHWGRDAQGNPVRLQ